MRVVKDPDERKQEILEAALRVFARKGYEKTSISDIAAEIGISQGLCYRYFPSKEMIYDMALDAYAEYIAQQNLERFYVTGKNLKEHIELMCEDMEKYKEAEKEPSGLYELFHQEGSKKMHDQLFGRVAQKLVPYVEKLLEEAVARGEIKIGDSHAAAVFCVYGQVGILTDDRISQEDKMPKIKQCLLELLL